MTVRGPRRRPGRWFFETGWRHAVVLAAVVFALFPVWWVVDGAFSTQGIASQEVAPRHWSLDNFRALLSDPGHPPFWRWFANSVIVGIASGLGTVLCCTLAAYAFSRLRFRGRRGGLLALLLTQMVPNALAVVAIYVFLFDVKGVFPRLGAGSLAGLVLVYVGGAVAVNTWMLKHFFDQLPRNLDESAKLDGATDNQVFAKVVLPLAVPVLVAIGLLSFVLAQVEFLLADTLLGANESSQTLASGLSRYVLAGYASRWGTFAAGSLIAAVPVVVLVFLLRRFVVSGHASATAEG